MNLPEIKTFITEQQGKKKLLNTQLVDAQKLTQEFSSKLGIIDQVVAILQLTAQETQETLKFHIEDMVQSALDVCFPDKYTFKVNFELKRGKTEARLILDSDGEEISPLDSNGGGVVDIISFALRITAWSLGKTDNMVILDEPFKFLSTGLRPLAGHILRKLSKKLKLQFLMVTHDQEMIDIADKVFEIDQDKKGVSFIKE